MPGIDSATKLCSHLDGVDGSTTFTDSSAGAHTITALGNAQVDTAQSVFGGASLLCDGSGDGLRLDGSSDFALGTGDFVIDFRVRLSSAGIYALADFNPDHSGGGVSPLIYVTSGDLIYYAAGGNRINRGSGLSTGTWYHVAAVRSSGVTRMFVDGVQTGSDYTDSNNYTVAANCPTFGIHADGSSFSLDGWMDEIRVSRGTDRGWFGGFTPPTAAYSADATPRSFAAVMG